MGTEIVNYDAQMAAMAEQYAQQDRASEGSFLSTRGGILMYGEEQMPGNQVACIIVDSILENAYYPQKYDPNNKLPPTCYAFTRGDPDDMQPHLESMSKDQNYFMPQNMQQGPQGLVIGGCNGCPMAEWGSSDTGRGKACKNQYRLALLPAGIYQPNGRGQFELGLFDDPAHFSGSDIIYLKLPVTSGAIFERYRKMLRVQHARPPFGVVTRIFLQPDPKNQFSVNFELIELLPVELTPAILNRNAEITAEPFKGYEAPDMEAQQQAAAPSSGRFGGGGFRRR